MLKDKFLDHCAWEEPECITRMSGDEYEKKFKCKQGRGNIDVSRDIYIINPHHGLMKLMINGCKRLIYNMLT